MVDDTRRITPGLPTSAPEREPPPPPQAFAALAERKAHAADEMPAVELPDGRMVVIARPKGSITSRIVMIASELTQMMKSPLAQATAITSLQPYIEAVMYVHAIDGKRVVPIMDAESYQAVADNLTDDGVNAVLTAKYERWPPPTPEKIKKNRERSQLS
ncbi:MAG: hypothetical protein ACRDRL_24845 [Sciscionella sp.]